MFIYTYVCILHVRIYIYICIHVYAHTRTNVDTNTCTHAQVQTGRAGRSWPDTGHVSGGHLDLPHQLLPNEGVCVCVCDVCMYRYIYMNLSISICVYLSIYPSIHPIHPFIHVKPATASTSHHTDTQGPPFETHTAQTKQTKQKTKHLLPQFRKQVPPAPAAPRVTRQAARHGQGDHASVALVVPPGSFTHTHMCVCVCVCERVYVITTNMCVMFYVWCEITHLLPSWCHVYLRTHDARERAGERERKRERSI